MLRSLNREDGTTNEDGNKMRIIATTYYKQLLTEDSMTIGEGTREDIILQSILRKLRHK